MKNGVQYELSGNGELLTTQWGVWRILLLTTIQATHLTYLIYLTYRKG